jgi:hypothetical protein
MSHRTGIRTLEWSAVGARRRAGVRGLVLSADVVVGISLALLVGGLGFLFVRQGTMIRYLTAECMTVREELTESQEINHSFALQLDQAFSLSRIHGLATGRLGMIEPSNPRYVRVSPNELP